MTLGARERVLYARHLLLHEIGSAGQERLCATHVRLPALAHAGTRAVATQYLQRAGIQVTQPGTDATGPGSWVLDAAWVGDSAAIDALSGVPELVHAAAALRGALVATEVIKRALELPTATLFPQPFCLASEAL